MSLVFSVGDKAVKNRELCTKWPLFGPRPFRHDIKRIMSQPGLILREFKRGNALREFVVCRERGQGEIQKGAEGENPKKGKAGIFPGILGQLGRAPMAH